MYKAMKKAVAASLFLVLCGCGLRLPHSRDISDFQLIEAMSVDTGRNEGMIVSLTSKALPNLQEGGESDSPMLAHEEAGVIAAALDKIQAGSDKHLFLGHMMYCLIGSEQAEHDLAAPLDFLTRYPPLRLDARILAVKDGTALELLEKGSGKEVFIADRLRSLEKELQLHSSTEKFSTVTLANMLDGGRGLLPVIKLEKKDGEEDEYTVEPDGYGIFKDGRVIAYLDREGGKGYNLLKNTAPGDTLSVSAPDGEKAALRLYGSSCELSGVWDGEEPVAVRVHLKAKASLVETLSNKPVGDSEAIEHMETEAKRLLSGRIEKAFEMGKKCDYMYLERVFRSERPQLWPQLKKRWEEIYPALKLDLSCELTVAMSYDINDPNAIGSERR